MPPEQRPPERKPPAKAGGSGHGWSIISKVSPSQFFTSITILILAFLPLIPRLLTGDLSGLLAWIIYIYNILKPIIIILDAILIALLVYVIIQVKPLQPRISLFHKKNKKKGEKDMEIVKGWDAVQKKAALGTPESLRLAVVEGDALVDLFLKRAGYPGETFADRVAVILPSEVKSLEALWRAHRLRNELVHTPSFQLSVSAGKAALAAYEDFLREMNAI